MSFFSKLLGTGRVNPSDTNKNADTETVRRIAAELNALSTDEARYLGAYAYVLVRTARADLHISEVETQKMEELVAKQP